MSNSSRTALRYGLLRAAQAEFLKIWASRGTLAFLLAIPPGCYLVVFELYHVERMVEHTRIRHALDALPMLFFGVWKLLLFQAAVMAFAVFWTTVDSQYGMVRVVCVQPLSRVASLLGKWLGIGAHLVLATLALVLSLVGWAVVYSGVRGIEASDLARVLRFALELLAWTLALGTIAMATASWRRTVAGGMVTSMIAVIALAVMTLLPFDVLAPRRVFMRFFFFPVQEFPNPFADGDSPFVRIYTHADFLTVVLITPLVFAIPALVYFSRRDITE